MSDMDCLVIGGGVHGLIAAACLARAGNRVLLLEARERLGGLCTTESFAEGFSAPLGAHAVYALDPGVVKDLRLARHGLQFAVRDMPLAGLDGDGKSIMIARDIHRTATGIAIHSDHDAKAWPAFRRELFDLARALRPWWSGSGNLPDGDMRRRYETLSRMGAAAWLDSWFETDLVKAALCFDATAGSLSTLDAGSALALVWRAAQEMSGLQGAVAQVKGDTLLTSLIVAAQANGAELRTGARVAEILTDGDAVAGARLENGETFVAPNVLCSPSCRQVLCGLVKPPATGIAQKATLASGRNHLSEAKVLLAVSDLSVLGGVSLATNARFVLAGRLETYATAEMVARAGQLANELPMEIAFLPAAGTPTQILKVVSMLIRPVPRFPSSGWSVLKKQLLAQATRTFERLTANTSARIVAAEVFTPDDLDARGFEEPHADIRHLTASPASRMETPLSGLLLCGADAEPLPAISGRAARLAASRLAGRA